MKKDVLYRHGLTVEFEDVDSYHIAHHSKLIAYFERARVHYFNSKGIDLKNMQYGLVIYKIESRFIKPARFLDRLSVDVSGIKMNNYSVTIDQRIMRGPDLLVKASIVQAFVSTATGETVSIPDDFLQYAAQELRVPDICR
jgi:acyl-CoA thioester hydrolase